MTPGRRRRPVAMLVHSYYEEDPRVRRQAETLVRAGREVDVVSLRRPGDPREGTLEGVSITRLDVQRHQGSPIVTYLAEYAAFLVRATFALARAHRRRRYGLVQVHTPPDFLVVAALPLRLLGVPVLLDFHEATPEFFRSRWPGASNPVTIGGLTVVERLAASVASRVLSVTEARHERLVALGIPARKLAVIRNGPVLARFDPDAHPRRTFMADGVLRVAYAGALTPLYALEDVVDAVAMLARERPALPVALDLYGRGDRDEGLRERAARLAVADRVHFHGRIPLDAVAGALAGADLVLSPIRRNRFSEMSLSTKVFEGAIMEKPVVAADLPSARAEFDGDMLAWYAPDDPADLARAILRVVDEPAWRTAAAARATVRARELAWDGEAPRYVALVEELAHNRVSS
ncbi:MAG TPA: glycosyltransferase family 4 protein [Candidatus Nanopelagicales bacterium]|nr:glycosyltransferase family 4 protein [Candidatus Nanopelagicales bacterium]